jgi:carotenoid cleavage dioxygenase-like enzyme
VRRRDFLRAGVVGSITLGATAAGWRVDRAGASTAPAEIPWWDRGNFRPVAHELSTRRLHVEGTIPRSLNGLYVRNGSNTRAGVPAHWFVGDGMVHGLWLGDGDARAYRNRWVRTETLAGVTPAAGGPPSLSSGLANVSVIAHAGRLLASGEIGLPWELDARDLSTRGLYDFGGRLTTSMTAHPKIDPVTGELHFFGYWFSPPFLTYHVADATGALVHSEPVDIPRSTMMHNFAITDRDVVFMDFPVTFDATALSTGIPYRWHPEAGARLGVMPLGGPASAIRWVDIEPGYVFHLVNAYRAGNDVVLDVCHHTKMFDPGVTDSGSPSLRRWRIATGGTALQFSEDIVAERDSGELPTSDPRLVGRPHRYGYLLSSRDEGVGREPHFAGVIKQDFHTGAAVRWHAPANLHGGEFLFVPTGRGEDHGYLLSYVFDSARHAGSVVILDARDVAAGPVATVALPARVPYGFHAAWVPA